MAEWGDATKSLRERLKTSKITFRDILTTTPRQSHSQATHDHLTMPTLNPFTLIKVFLFFWLCSVFLSADAHPADKQDGSTSPTTAPGKLLKLALQKAEEVKQERAVYKERHELKVQKVDEHRHDRAWAQQKDSNKDKQEN
jgi:hypothetical protein